LRLASQNEGSEPWDLKQHDELRRYRDLKRDLNRIEAKVQATRQALARAQSTAQSQARVQKEAQARAKAEEEARARRLRAIAARSLWRVLQARRSLWDGLARNLHLGMRVIGLVVWMLPAADRSRWSLEAYGELEALKGEEAPLLGDAIRIAVRVPWLAVVVRTHAWVRSPIGRWLSRREPLWMGLGVATATFLVGLAGIGQSPTDRQMRLLMAASLLFGVLAAWEAYKGRRP
jgi:hypothetical protein